MKPPRLPREILPVLLEAWRGPFTTRSNFARDHAELVAIASQAALLTTRTTDPQEPWGRCWRITARGLRLLERNTS